MSVNVFKNRFILSSYERWITLHIANNVSDLYQLGSRLVIEAEKAQAFRETEVVQGLSLILSQIPIQEYQLIGQFYQGYIRATDNARKLLENVVEKSKTYKSKALIALATLELQVGNCDSGIKFCTEAIRQSNTISTTIHAARSIAVIKAAEGLHRSALKDLEAIVPFVRYAPPIARYQYLNSLAVELGEAGRIEEAQDVCRIVLASPFINAYPEWRETGEELRGYRQSRSVVSLTLKPIPQNIIPLPERRTDTNILLQGKASIVNLELWKKKMGKAKNGEDKTKLPENMDSADMVVMLMNLVTQEENATEEKLSKVLKYALEVFSKK